MNSSRIRDWLEIIGLFSVVTSLIFVGIQMRQSQDIAIANQYQARFDSFLSIQLGLLENVHTLRFTGGIARSRYREIASVDQLTLLETMDDEELGATYLYAFMTLKQFDNLYFQYQAGFLADTSWQPLQAACRAFLAGGAQIVYQITRHELRSEFQQLVDEMIDQEMGSE
jgi:hypothetical protein